MQVLSKKNWKENPFKNCKKEKSNLQWKENPTYNWKEKSIKKGEIEKCWITKMKFQLESGTKSPFRNWKKLKKIPIRKSKKSQLRNWKEIPEI